MYGGRPLGTSLIHLLSVQLTNDTFVDVRFNDRWHTFTPSAAKGGQAVPMQAEAA